MTAIHCTPARRATVYAVDGAPRCQLGESPRWDPVGNRLYWVDLLAGLVHAFDPATGRTATTVVGQPVSALARHEDGWVVAVETGVQYRDGRFALLEEHPLMPRPTVVRMNDGELDPAGRFLLGTLSYDGRPGAGVLYSVGDEGPRILLRNLDISNGIAFSADGGTMYHVDSGRRLVRRYAYDSSTGTLAGGADFYRHPDDDGALPDGITLDAAGGLWVALWGGGRIIRLDPGGRVTAEVAVPATQPSSVEFGGPDRSVLFVTSARDGLSERRVRPGDGRLFALCPVVPGAAQKLVRLTPTTWSAPSTRKSAR